MPSTTYRILPVDYAAFISKATPPDKQLNGNHLDYFRWGRIGELGEIIQLCSKALRYQTNVLDPLSDDIFKLLINECGDIVFYGVAELVTQDIFNSSWGYYQRTHAVTLNRATPIKAIANIAHELIKVPSGTHKFIVPESETMDSLAIQNKEKLENRARETGDYAKAP